MVNDTDMSDTGSSLSGTGGLQATNGAKDKPVSVSAWLTSEGKKKLDESLKRLKLDQSKLTGKGLASLKLETLHVDDLNNEKKNVKNQLKLYDSAFIATFNKAPQRNDKEPMRPLYMYYKKLKHIITKKQKEPNNNDASNRGNSVGSGIGSTNMSVSSAGGSASGFLSSDGDKPKKEIKLDQSVNEVLTKAGLSTKQDVTQKISSLKAERSALRIKLDEFQKEFLKTYNRKIRYTKDIAPVSHEFKRYKELKGEIAKFEGIIEKMNEVN